MAALTYPLPAADFWDKLRINSMRLHAPEPQQVDQTAGGTILKASMGDTLWQGTVSLADDSDFDRGTELEALMSLVSRAGASFLMYDTRKCYPKADPGGSIISGSSPTIDTIDSDNRRLSLTGLPGGYIISAGDMIGFQYSGTYALHRVVVGGLADGSGNMGLIEVTPFISANASAGAAVSLVKPLMKAVMRADPDYGAARPGRIMGPGFGFVQTLG